MAGRARSWALILWLATAVVAVGNAVLNTIAWSDLAVVDSYTNMASSVASIFYATLGVIVVVRASNRIGWLLLAVALMFATMSLTSAYAVVAVLTHPGALAAGKLVGAASEWLFIPVFALMAVMLLVFPTGLLPSPRWRPATATVLAIVTLTPLSSSSPPARWACPRRGGVSLVYDNPVALERLGSFGGRFGSLNGLAVVYLVLLALALVALVVRYRQGSTEVRRQILWVVLVVGVGLALQVVATLAQVACGCAQSPVAATANLAQGVVALVGVPLAITIAILKYRLYQIERLVNRALVYTALTVTLGAVYLGSVLLLQLVLDPITTQSDVAVAASTLAAAALFQPARHRIQRAVDRRFYRNRYDATTTLDSFAAQLRHELDLDTVAGDLRSAVHETWQPTHVSLWLRP